MWPFDRVKRLIVSFGTRLDQILEGVESQNVLQRDCIDAIDTVAVLQRDCNDAIDRLTLAVQDLNRTIANNGPNSSAATNETVPGSLTPSATEEKRP